MEPVSGGGIYAVRGDPTSPSALWFSQSQSTIPFAMKVTAHVLLERDIKRFHLHAVGIHGYSILFVKCSLRFMSWSFTETEAGAQLCW